MRSCLPWFTVLGDRGSADPRVRGAGFAIVAAARIAARIVRLTSGNFGDVAPVGEGVSELRIDHGPGYRVYFQQRGGEIVLLLCGGDKADQARDIRRAKALAAEI